MPGDTTKVNLQQQEHDARLRRLEREVDELRAEIAGGDLPWDEARADKRSAIGRIVANTVGEQVFGDLVRLVMPPPATEALQTNPLDLADVTAPRVWQAVTPPLYEVIAGRAQAIEVTAISKVYHVTTVGAPFEAETPRMQHGGHKADQQDARSDSSGRMQIVTSIVSESSQTFSVASVHARIQPMHSGGTLSFRPSVDYWADHYVTAAGGGGSHSDGFIHAAVFSVLADGTDMRPEVAARGLRIWDTRASGLSEAGHPFGSSGGPDSSGTASGVELQVDVGNLDLDRVYLGQVRIESHSDADGDSLTYPSAAQVQFYATLRWAVVEQTA